MSYNVHTSGPAKAAKEAMLDTVRMLLENIQTAKVRNTDELPPAEKIAPEQEDAQNEKIITIDGIELTPLSSKIHLDINKWSPVIVQDKEKKDTIEEIMTYLRIEVGMEIFDFGGLKCKFSMVPGFESEYDGTVEEKQKHDDYVEMVATLARIQMLEAYLKTFDGLILLPLAAQNESSVSDSDITISIQIENSTAEAIYPTAELICDDLKGAEGYIYEDGLVEITLAQNDTVDIKNSRDDSFWDMEDQRSEMNAMLRGGINGQSRYTEEDYVRELSRYIASPEVGNPDVFSFHIPSLHAKESKWLSSMIILRPLKETIQLSYSIKSSSSNGDLAGTLELTV